MMLKRWIYAVPFVALSLPACGGKSDSDLFQGSGGTAGAAGSSGSAGSAGTAGSGGSSGGSGGSGGSAGSGSGGSAGSGPGPECVQDGDCKLFSDCCTCLGFGPDTAPPPSCAANCFQTKCSELGVTEPKCRAGRCVAGFDCNQTHAFCNLPRPMCPPGQVASVQNGCFGACVPASQCESVESCSECTGKAETCVVIATENGDQNNNAHCVAVPAQCRDNPTCECMGGSVCVAPFDACGDFSGIRGMGCSCPACDDFAPDPG